MARWFFFEKQVHHPLAKAGMVGILTVIGLACVPLSPVLYVAHRKLRASGRNGFYYDGHIVLGKKSFARRTPAP